MTLWRLEWIRLVRSRRWVALVGVFLFFGLLGPLTAAFLPEILEAVGGDLEGAIIELPPPTAVDGMGQYISNAIQIGVLVSVVVAASAVAFDAVPEMGVFLRSRVRRVSVLLLPRAAVAAGAVVAAFWLGTFAAWYETAVLIEAPDPVAVLLGGLLASLFLVFAVAVVTFMSGVATSVAGIVIWSLVVLLTLPILGIVERIGRWLPSHLPGAMPALVGGAEFSDYLVAVAVTVGLTIAAFAGGARLIARREL